MQSVPTLENDVNHFHGSTRVEIRVELNKGL